MNNDFTTASGKKVTITLSGDPPVPFYLYAIINPGAFANGAMDPNRDYDTDAKTLAKTASGNKPAPKVTK